MDTTFSTRTDLLRLVLATALAMLCVSVMGTLTAFASLPVLRIVNDYSNGLVIRLTVALINALTIGLVFLGLRVARSRAVASPASVWGQNAAVLEIAKFITLVYLAEIVVSFIGHEARTLVEFPLGNAIQFDVSTPTTGRVLFEGLFPAVGVALLLIFGTRFLRK